VLTRETLAVLTRTLLASLREVREVASGALPESEWYASIALPLRVTTTELVGGIHKRQRSFDLQQEGVQREMAALIASDWLAAVERCEDLLETTSRALSELGALLLKDSHEILATLQDIQDACQEKGYSDGVAAAQRVADQVAKAAAWGAARQRAFGEHYEYVHRYLRDVVRIDPARTLLHRLREQLLLHAKGGEQPEESPKTFALVVAHAAPFRVLRDAESKRPQPPVVRTRRERDKSLAVVATADPEALLEDKVRDVLRRGETTLSEITRELTAELPKALRFLEAGRIAEAVVRVRPPLARAERPWVMVAPAPEFEALPVLGDDTTARAEPSRAAGELPESLPDDESSQPIGLSTNEGAAQFDESSDGAGSLIHGPSVARPGLRGGFFIEEWRLAQVDGKKAS
jgi:chromosome partition protein MukF